MADIVHKATQELKKHSFPEDKLTDKPKLSWTSPQIWHIFREFQDNEVVSYAEMQYSNLFKGDASPLIALERADVISVTYEDGNSEYLYFAAIFSLS